MTEPQAMTTAGLQAKVELRRAWFEAHPNQAVPEARAEVERLFAAIEAEAALVRTPETLDVERLRAPYGGHPEFGPRVVANQAQPSIAGWESLAKDALLAFDQARAALAASPAPDPGAGPACTCPYTGGLAGNRGKSASCLVHGEQVRAELAAALAPSAEPPDPP